MVKNRQPFYLRLAGLALFTGGLLMAVLWIVFTSVHGPTSYDLDRAFLGGGTLFWGSLLSIVPSVLVALGLGALGQGALGQGMIFPQLAIGSTRIVRIGYILTMISLVLPAALDLFVWGGLGPPFFVPILGIGLIMLSLGFKGSQPLRWQNHIFMGMGISLLIAFFLSLNPFDFYDQFYGYRIYGLFAHLIPAVGWMVTGEIWLSHLTVL